MENTAKKDVSALLCKISGIVLIVVSALYALYHVCWRFVYAFIYPMVYGYSNDFFDVLMSSFYGLICIALYLTPLLIAGILLLTKKKSNLVFLLIACSAWWFCGNLCTALESIFEELLYEMNITESIVSIGYVILSIIVVCMVVGLALLCALLLRKRKQVFFFVCAGLGVVDSSLYLLSFSYNIVNSSFYYIGLYIINLFLQLVMIFLRFSVVAAIITLGISTILHKKREMMEKEAEDNNFIDTSDLSQSQPQYYAPAAQPMGQPQYYAPAAQPMGQPQYYAPQPQSQPQSQTQSQTQSQPQYYAPAPHPMGQPQQAFRPQPAPQPAPQQNYASKSETKIGIADEIMKYEGLYNRGIITKEQFEEKKNQLLNM